MSPSLLLFLPTPSSLHMLVKPVTENAKGKRLVLGGGKDASTAQGPVLEDICIHEEDHN
jgi:hypothetical protein